MPRPRSEATGGAGAPQDAQRAEFSTDVPPRNLSAPQERSAWEAVGLDAHFDAAQQATNDEPQGHSVGAGRVLTDTVTKWDNRTAGQMVVWPAGTPLTHLPEWAAKDVLENDNLHRAAD